MANQYMKDQYMLRIDEHLFSKFKYIANENTRSINKEIEYVIKQYVAKYEKENGTINTSKD